jgi:uncharacterized protein (TIGR02271 family)
MATTLVGYFDDYNEARQTEQDLIRSGFRGEEVTVMYSSEGRAEVRETEAPSMWERIKSAFGFASEEDRSAYEEAARRGGALLSVRVPEDQLDEAASIIERHHPVDLDKRIEEWRGVQAAAGTTATEGAQRVPIASEELQVGKRAVRRGGVRVHTHVSETPVEEQVTLREEQAYVERRPTERVTEPGEAAFQERTIEVQETGEEPVVAKQARVVEELEVGKEATERRETVRDTVRKTEVDVDREETTPKKP